MQFDDSAQIDALSVLPAMAPMRPEQTYSWNTPWRAVKAGVADVLGSTADVIKGFSAGSAITAQADPVALAVLGEEKIREGADIARRQIASDEALTSDIGTSFRNVSASMRPDPATASTAERVVFGVVRAGGKLATGAAFGPIGIAGASAEEGFTTAEDLRREGVTLGARTAVGSVTAGATAVTATLPMAGPTLKSTAALYLAGGPGGFMAQQAATSAILESADYHDLAKQYDPLDPVGLALSALVPLPFAAAGARRVRATPEAVDAAMTHNLSIAQDAAEHRAMTEPPAEPMEPAPRAPPSRPAPELPSQPESVPASTDDMTVVRQRVAQLEQESPAAAAEMEKLRTTLKEGDDVELGTLDADLLRVAAECALSIGSS